MLTKRVAEVYIFGIVRNMNLLLLGLESLKLKGSLKNHISLFRRKSILLKPLLLIEQVEIAYVFYFLLLSPISQIHRHFALQLISQKSYVPTWWTLGHTAQTRFPEGRIYNPPLLEVMPEGNPQLSASLGDSFHWRNCLVQVTPPSRAAHIPNDPSMWG